MDIVKIVGIGIITTIAVLAVKQVRPDFAVIVGLAGSIIILVMLMNQLGMIISYLGEIVTKTHLKPDLFTAVLKIVGVGYLTEFAANICTDAGSANVGEKILLAGKVLILCLALPIITSLLDIVIGIMP